jgi:hypothetical protein
MCSRPRHRRTVRTGIASSGGESVVAAGEVLARGDVVSYQVLGIVRQHASQKCDPSW